MKDFIHVDIPRTASTSVRKALGLGDTPMHVPARQKRDQDPQRWENALTFTFVRNPFDRIVSQYLHRRALEGCPTFEAWMVRRYVRQDRECEHTGHLPYFNRLWWPQVDWITGEGGDVIVDFIGRFERLQTDWLHLCSRLGRNVRLPHTGKLAYDAGPYEEYHTERTIEITEERFAADLEQFGYIRSQLTPTHDHPA